VFFAWVRQMAYYFSQRDYDKYQQCKLAIECFTDYAEAWFYCLEDDLRRQRLRPVETWERLIFYMAQQYAPEIDAWAYAIRTRSRSKPHLVVNTECYQAQYSPPILRPQQDDRNVTPPTPAPMPTVCVEETIAPIVSPPMDVVGDELPIVSTPIVEHVIASRAIVDPPMPLVSTIVRFVAPIPMKPDTTVHVSDPTAPLVLAPTVVVFAKDHILPPANTSSKRGRFECKGGRMMRSTPIKDEPTTRRSRPRPWRPPWCTTKT